MDFLETHLEQTARRIADPNNNLSHQFADFVEKFLASAPKRWRTAVLSLSYPPGLILMEAARVLEQDGFDLLGGTDPVHNEIIARYEANYEAKSGWLSTFPRRVAKLDLEFEVRIGVAADGKTKFETSQPLITWQEDFEKRLRTALAAVPEIVKGLATSIAPGTPLHNPVLRPGQELKAPFTGNLKDYSGCASEKEVEDLRAGVLPLGTWAFATDPDDDKSLERGDPLYLSNWRTGAPMIYNGALVCAPQNSGKTELIKRWAIAANRKKYSIFLIDVKGNMRDELAPKLGGKVFCFSTDPKEECDCINFLAGLHGTTPEDSRRVRQLVEALLPRDGWEEGEQAYFYQNHFNWFSALVHLTLLTQYYQPDMFDRGVAHLGHVYELATSYDQLMIILRNIERFEARERDRGGAPLEPGLNYWRSEIALLIHPDDGGERTGDYSYRTLTGSIVNALRPFSRFGTLHAKSGGPRMDGTYPPVDKFFSLEMLGGKEPVTIVLAAREQDLDDGTTVLAIAIRKLQQFLFERMKTPGLNPILLLLDETRRIRGFKANEYITFARQAQAGCVLVYQSLDQIGEEAKINEILENVGTQIFLGSLAGKTAGYFIDMLPVRSRPVFSHTMSFGQGGGPSVQTGQDTVGYFSTGELYRLPAGEWPALVYINGQPRRKPFLVDMSRGKNGDRP